LNSLARRCANTSNCNTPTAASTAGHAGKLDLLALEDGVADAQIAGVHQSDDVAGERFLDGLAIVAERRGGVLGSHRATRANALGVHAALEATRAHARERQTVAVIGIHVGLDLEHEAGEVGIQRAFVVVHVDAWQRWRRQLGHRVEQGAHTEVGERRTHEHRCALAGQERRKVDVGTDGVEQTTAIEGHLPGVALLRGRALGGDDLLGGRRRTARRARVLRELAGTTVDGATEVARDAHGPRGRCGAQPDLLLHLVEKFQRVATGTIELVEERQHRQVARAAHVEQLQRLGLDALGRVEHHDDRVHRGQHAVGVLAEVAVTRRVEQVEHMIAIRELQHGRRDGDASLLLHLHPVRGGRALTGAGAHRPGFLHRAGVQQEFLGEAGLAGVGVADDGERSTTRGLRQDARTRFHGS